MFNLIYSRTSSSKAPLSLRRATFCGRGRKQRAKDAIIRDFEAAPRFGNRDSEHDQSKVDKMLEYENSITINLVNQPNLGLFITEAAVTEMDTESRHRDATRGACRKRRPGCDCG